MRSRISAGSSAILIVQFVDGSSNAACRGCGESNDKAGGGDDGCDSWTSRCLPSHRSDSKTILDYDTAWIISKRTM